MMYTLWINDCYYLSVNIILIKPHITKINEVVGKATKNITNIKFDECKKKHEKEKENKKEKEKSAKRWEKKTDI